MAYSYKNSRGITYFLHGRKRALKSGKEQILYFFSKEQKEGVLNLMPDGYEVSETPNGLPVLKRSDTPIRSGAGKKVHSRKRSNRKRSGTHGSGGGP